MNKRIAEKKTLIQSLHKIASRSFYLWKGSDTMKKIEKIKSKKYITSDLSGRLQLFEDRSSPLNIDLKKGDYLFVSGDFGFVWNPESAFEEYYLKYIQKKPYTTCFIDGNHENFDELESYPVEEWNGGKVHVIRKDADGTAKIIHLMRGEYYNIDGETFFTFGGGDSSDKELREAGETWWLQEMPTEQEMQYGLDNLGRHGWKCDYIISHALPEGLIRKEYRHSNMDEKPLNIYLERIREKTTFKHWYSGHIHENKEIDSHYTVLYKCVRDMDTNKIIVNNGER